MKFFVIFVIILFLILTSCRKEMQEPKELLPIKEVEVIEQIKSAPIIKEEKLLNIKDYNDTTFVKLDWFSKDFIYDMKYATEDNFLKEKVYDCAECYLRAKTIKALIEVNKELLKQGYKIKLFDCYRPLDIQKKMWKIVPHTNYVANPIKGSVHNRGGAVDLTLVDLKGEEINMGTSFDFFGLEAHHDYKKLAPEIIIHRKLLKKIMLRHNFRSINSEWWHYNLKGATNYKVSNFRWECE